MHVVDLRQYAEITMKISPKKKPPSSTSDEWITITLRIPNIDRVLYVLAAIATIVACIDSLLR